MIDDCLERLGAKGCVEVTRIINLLESGQVVTEVSEFTPEERQYILYELKAVMLVYQKKVR